MADDKPQKQWSHFRDLVAHVFLESGHPCADADIAWYPATDAYQTDEVFVVRMELSGVSREDLRIRLHGRILEVRGVRKDPAAAVPRRFHKMEIARGPFVRKLELPGEFGGGSGGASYRDGILEIRIRRKRRAVRRIIDIDLPREAP